MSVSLTLSWYAGSSSIKSKRCKIMEMSSMASCMAKGRPMQARWPLPKGFQALGGIFSIKPGSKRSGRNSSIERSNAGLAKPASAQAARPARIASM